MEEHAQIESEPCQSTQVSLQDDFTFKQQSHESIEKLQNHIQAKRPRLSDDAENLAIGYIEGLKNTLCPGFVLLWREIETAFKSRISTGEIKNTYHIEPLQFLQHAKNIALENVRNAMQKHKNLKVNTVFIGDFVAGDKRSNMHINTKNSELFFISDLEEWYESIVKDTLTRLEEFQERDSGWTLSQILSLVVNINEYNPFHAGCSIQLPDDIINKRTVINVKSKDKACFAWAIVAALHPIKQNAGRSSKYPSYESVLKLQDIKFPMSMNQITKFESLNDISINVFTMEKEKEKKGKILPIRLTKQKMDKHINLLYIPHPQRNKIGHFAWIKNLSRLVSSQLSKSEHKKHICDRCLHYFNSTDKLEKHTADCQKMNDCAIVLPSENEKLLSFNNYNRKERLPFVIYADLEAILEKIPKEDEESYAYQRHRVYSIGYYMHCSYEQSALSTYQFYRDPDCVLWFVKQLEKLAKEIYGKLSADVSMETLSAEQSEKFDNATHCHVCEKSFAPNDIRAHDHCHLTGRYRGPAHSNCNLNYKDFYCIPVVFHNLSGYDAHFIIKEIAKEIKGSIEVLPITKEKYISFTKTVEDTSKKQWQKRIKLRFIDSYKFLNTSLDKLASFLSKDKLKILRSQFPNESNEDFDLLTRKGVYPHEYVDCLEKLQEVCLPPRESFYSSLTGDTVSESDYAHAVEVWKRFDIKTLGEYSDLYLTTDVLLLADIFENFRDSCMNSYGLDPAYYYTLPGFTWDAMLKYTGIKFELLTDIDMVMFIERGIRGGLSQCSNRYAKANNKYMKHDSSEPSSYLMYFDVNNLYGWAMCQPLPYAKFRWVGDASKFDLSSIAPNSSTGYILEVDLEYPQSLHDKHKDLPFCPICEKPPGKKQDKLLATLCDKQRYVIHYRNLQQCVSHGLRITKIHRVLQFSQSPWMRGYIELNTQFRTRATNEFEKNLYKLMNNAVFGKTMENVRNRVDVKLLTQWNGRFGAEAMIAKPNFHSRSIFSDDFIAVELRKLEVKFNKPIYVGMCILDISKTRLYEFHHDYMFPLYGSDCKLMYTDTDSLIYFIKCDDVYKRIKDDIGRFDTSDYLPDNAYGIPCVNKKVPGLMKDENNGQIMTEFVGLRSKMYALRVDGKSDIKKAKGVKSNIVARTITFDDYTQCLWDEDEKKCRQSYIKSELHEVFTVSETKIALSPYDDKRYIIPGSTDTLPWGHYKIPK